MEMQTGKQAHQDIEALVHHTPLNYPGTSEVVKHVQTRSTIREYHLVGLDNSMAYMVSYIVGQEGKLHIDHMQEKKKDWHGCRNVHAFELLAQHWRMDKQHWQKACSYQDAKA
jgi:hypothetical protein